MKTSYINCVLITPEKDSICLVFKNRGPSEVLHKFNFIGGKIENNESPESALFREVLEETGLNISFYNPILVSKMNETHFELFNFLVVIPKYLMLQARSCESEKVSVVSLNSVLSETKQLPKKYSNNFPIILNQALNI